MASNWRAAVSLIDSKQLKTTLVYKGVFDGLSLTDEFGLANDALDGLLTDLGAVTDAAVYSVTLGHVRDTSEAIPAEGVADITDEAAVVTWLSDVGQANKFHTLRIPAPIDMFGSDQITVDVTNANLIAYVANFAAGGFQVSDEESIVTSRDNGIVSGHWRSRAKSTA